MDIYDIVIQGLIGAGIGIGIACIIHQTITWWRGRRSSSGDSLRYAIMAEQHLLYHELFKLREQAGGALPYQGNDCTRTVQFILQMVAKLEGVNLPVDLGHHWDQRIREYADSRSHIATAILALREGEGDKTILENWDVILGLLNEERWP